MEHIGCAYSSKYVKSLINMRLSDQFIQSLESKLRHFENLLLCKSLFPYRHSQYLDDIKNVKIRNIFTRLRVNNNKLMAYCHKGDGLCSHCQVPETASHFLFTCSSGQLPKIRKKFEQSIKNIAPVFGTENIDDKLSIVLSLNFSWQEAIKIACSYVKDMYNHRFKVNRNP